MSALVFDADDTLWENNVRFVRALDEFIEFLAHPTLTGDDVRAEFLRVQRDNIASHGYGAGMFVRSMHDCFAALSGPAAPSSSVDERRDRIELIGRRLTDGEMELIPGVERTLAELKQRHDLILLTKGSDQEQRPKVDRSGLSGYFRAAHIVAEKDVTTYQWLLAEHDLDADTTWMIGNSPKSDIAPARAAGLNAVFIPHPHTWELEHTEIDPTDDRIIQLAAFTELLSRF